MRNFWILFKVFFLNNLGINKLQKKFSTKSRFSQISSVLLIIFLALIVLASIGVYLYMFFSFFIMTERYEGILLFGITIGVIFALFTSFTISNSYLFESKDYDLLMAMPIKPKTIIATKVVSLLLINYLTYAIIYIPSIIIYGIYVGPGILFYLGSIIIFFVGPLLAITIASTIAYYANILVSRFKFKNAIKTIGSLIFFLAIIFLSFSINYVPEIDPDELDPILPLVDGMINAFEKIYYPGTWAVRGLEGEILLLLAYIGITIIPFLLFINLVGRNFSKAVARTKVSYRNKNFVLGEQKETSQVKALLKREFKMYFSNSSIVLNTIVGPIMSTVLVLIFLFSVRSEPEFFELITSQKRLMLAVVLGISLFMMGMMSTTTNSISLEGKLLWIIKAAPIDAKDIFKAKILMNFLISLPFIIINTVSVGIILRPIVFDLIMFLVIPMIYNLVIGSYGLYINLVFPKLEWENPVKVVKQSASSIITMFSGMIFAGLIIVAIIIFGFLGVTITYVMATLLLITILILLIVILNTNGKKRFFKLKA